jgi:hypothetical protein
LATLIASIRVPNNTFYQAFFSASISSFEDDQQAIAFLDEILLQLNQLDP